MCPIRPMVSVFILLALFAHPLQGAGEGLPIKYRKATLGNGLKIILVEHHELPTIAIELLVRAGSAYDPPVRPGLAHMVSSLILEGTTARTSQQVSEEIDFIGGTLRTDCSYDSTSISATALRKDFSVILSLLNETVRSPSFPPEEVERQRDKAIISILRERDNRKDIANRHFSDMLFRDHPYGHPPIGTEEGLKAVTREEIVEFHKRYYLPNNSIIAVVGDIEPASILEEVRRALGDWKAGEVQEPVLSLAGPVANRRIRLINKPNLTQTEIKVGCLGIERTSPEYFSLLLLNHILGEGPSSRLMEEVRAKRGLTYSVKSQFSAMRYKGIFSVNTYTKNKTALETLKLVLGEIQRLRDAGVTQEELSDAKAYYVGHFPMTVETPAQIASKIIEQEFYGLPEDYIERYIEMIGAVSLQEVNTLAGKFLDPDNMIIVLVSKADEVLEEVKTLGETELKEL